jgi:phosphoribosylglycinamide formyltransferase 1
MRAVEASYPRPEQLPSEPKTLRLAVLISGGGTTMANLADAIRTGRLDARIEIVVSSRDRAAGIERGRERGLDVQVLPRKQFVKDGIFDPDAYTAVLMELLTPRSIDLVVLGGFMSQLGRPLFDRYPVVNVHPALLPRYGGAGMYGHHVHEAVLAAGESESGCTVHFADPEYDHGPILAQRRVAVVRDDTPDSLAERVQGAERELYPEAIGWIAAGRVRIKDGALQVVA